MNTNDPWESLIEAYKKNGIALVLGAGVSYASNIPSWNDLLSVMVKNHVEGANRKTVETLKENGMSLPAIASLLEEKCGSRVKFVNEVRETLYIDFPFYDTRVDKHNRWAFAKFVREGGMLRRRSEKQRKKYKPNLTLRSIGALCVVQRMGKNNRGKDVPRNFANSKIRAIVTLNMDALLQTYVYAFTTKHLIRTVERPSAQPFSECINLYHMHGYLHFEKGKRAKREAMEAVVLTEQDYYDFFNEPNSMFNYTFLYLLREYSCLFIGLSMDDENIRRLLHYSKLERLKALADKSGIPLENLVKRKQGIRKHVMRHFAILQRDKRRSAANHAREETLRPLGVNVLWVDDFGEIPDRLQQLYESEPGQEGKWTEVYDRIT